MENHLICLDFFGLPGSGKSLISHRVAEALRARGFIVSEPSYRLDNQRGKAMRRISKVYLSALLMFSRFKVFKKIVNRARDCGYTGKELFVQSLNILYKFYCLFRQKNGILIFDEGLIQSCISLSAKGKYNAVDIYGDLAKLSPVPGTPVMVSSSIDESLRNLDSRANGSSRVEKAKSLSEKQALMSRILDQVESFRTLFPSLQVLSFSPDGDYEHFLSTLIK